MEIWYFIYIIFMVEVTYIESNGILRMEAGRGMWLKEKGTRIKASYQRTNDLFKCSLAEIVPKNITETS